jgi:hypothetical protein
MPEPINPYQSPSSAQSDGTPPWLPRSALLHPFVLMVVGATLGYVSFVVAISRVPTNVADGVQHDLLLANYLGFIFPPLIGLWAGWIRQSWPWSAGGVVIGLAIGGAYRLLCCDNPFALMVAFPCLLGGVASAALGNGSRSWFDGLHVRFGRGLVAGFVLGFTYMLVLNVCAAGWVPFKTVAEYHKLMEANGPVAMALASGFYLMLFVWATNLKATVLRTATPAAVPPPLSPQ